MYTAIAYPHIWRLRSCRQVFTAGSGRRTGRHLALQLAPRRAATPTSEVPKIAHQLAPNGWPHTAANLDRLDRLQLFVSFHGMPVTGF